MNYGFRGQGFKVVLFGPRVLGSISGLGFAWIELDLRASCFKLPLLFCWVTEWELELRNLELLEIEYPSGPF